MPYFAVPKDSAEDCTDYQTAIDLGYPSFTTASEAHASTDRAVCKVLFYASPSERHSWRERENDRFNDGTYQSTPWCSQEKYYLHYAHLSTKQPGLIAYTKNDEHGIADRQTVIRPGRYLEEFYSEYWDKEKRDRLTAECDVNFNVLAFARTPDEIETLYNGADFNSCMRYKVGSSNFSRKVSEHPTRVYGDSDLAVAYFGPLHACKGRAIVWPSEHVYTRLYGDGDRLAALLRAAGYTAGDHGSLDGARIRRIELSSGYVLMPYIDWHPKCSEDRSGRYLVIGDGDIDTQTTNGCTELEQPMAQCANCGDSYRADENDDCGYCPSCEENRSYCENCDSDTWDAVCTENHTLCESCAREDHHECCIEDCSNEWYDIDFTATERRIRHDNRTTDMCAECAAVHTVCRDCDQAFEHADHLQCPDCQLTPRCTRTLTLAETTAVVESAVVS
jgi:hypothetical protein